VNVNAGIELFTLLATEDRLLTDQQCLILREVCAPDIKPGAFVDFVSICGLPVAREQLDDIATRISAQLERESTGEVESRAKPKGGWDVPAELDWFCYLAIQEKVLSDETCLCVVSSLEGTSDLLSFAETLVQYGLCDDHARVQQLTEAAVSKAKTGQRPPSSVFKTRK
jgi:hypothetical protein